MKKIIIALFLMLSLNTAVMAQPQFYQYDGDLPFIEMMLNMMTAMGMIDKVPPQLLNYYAGNYGYPQNYSGNYSGHHPGNYPDNNYSNNIRPRFNAPANIFYPDIMPPGFNPNNSSATQSDNSALNGVWVTSQGEMLGINQLRFLWGDGRSRYLMGDIKIQQDRFALRVNGNGPVLQYQYRFENNFLITQDNDGVLRKFRRYR